MFGIFPALRARLLAVTAASLLALCLLFPTTAAGSVATASIKLKPTVGSPTTKTKVIGSAFGPTEQIVITFDSKDVGAATTDAKGAFAKKVQVPASALPGIHKVKAK